LNVQFISFRFLRIMSCTNKYSTRLSNSVNSWWVFICLTYPTWLDQ